jgi:hypothetical protein
MPSTCNSVDFLNLRIVLLLFDFLKTFQITYCEVFILSLSFTQFACTELNTVTVAYLDNTLFAL